MSPKELDAALLPPPWRADIDDESDFTGKFVNTETGRSTCLYNEAPAAKAIAEMRNVFPKLIDDCERLESELAFANARLANEHQLRLDTVAGWELAKSELVAIKTELNQGGPWSEGKTLAELVRILIDDRQRVRDECFFHALEALGAKEERDAAQAENQRLQKRETELLQSNTREVENRRAVDRRAAQAQFFNVVGQDIPRTPAIPCEEVMLLRFNLVGEEIVEWVFAMFGPVEAPRVLDCWAAWGQGYVPPPVIGSLPEIVKEMADVGYTVEGTALAMGFDMNVISRLVHESNLSKRGAPRNEAGKVLKGSGYQPPPIREALEAMGWRDSVRSVIDAASQATEPLPDIHGGVSVPESR